ncbi:MAG: HU family DNA-binding protein [Methylacidiphilales bacterium]|nr:HU family DNA-binding protein [Candidatus Methylacidiphilales bacterium]
MNIKAKPMSTSEVVKEIATRTELSSSEVKKIIESLKNLMIEQLNDSAVRQFVIPGILKLKTVEKPAVPERKGINPFTKQETIFKARPAKKIVKASVLKALKNL